MMARKNGEGNTQERNNQRETKKSIDRANDTHTVRWIQRTRKAVGIQVDTNR